ncbi:c-type cytochrome [Alkalihalobacillus pseudalcaliphilus]|uniref:c-type cytochrome n=1 Tax=Alkalihalobacillus pseudalcaliphilus TaxID=79884 RepID=UPI00064DC9E7|nr:c-type cytochrome [Alkalihalobacillus pseudalcaliphilus]KMK77449.1 cytochrome C551 [Alkalihalobacillus pseudalcaliphilus]
MKKFLIALGLVVALTACGGGDDNTAPEEDTGTETPAGDEEANDVDGGTVDVAQAEEVYNQSCIGCHGGDLSGGGGPALTGKGFTADDIYTVIRNGQGTMPSFSESQISDEEAENLALWIEEQQ